MKKYIYLNFLRLILLCALLLTFAVSVALISAIRINNPGISAVGVFAAVLPAAIGAVAVVLLFAGSAAKRLAKNIADSLNSVDFDADEIEIYDELLPYLRKIEKQKKVLREQIAALKSRAVTIKAVTGNMKEGLIVIDKTGMVLTINKSASEIFLESDADGENILHLCRDMEFQGGVKKCLSGMSAELIFRHGAKIYDVFFSPAHDNKEISGGVILLLDISEKHEAERQRREFSANVSHELKTPLTTISALAEMIENDMAKQSDVKAFAGKISQQASRLISVIEDIIKLSEFDEGIVPAEYSSLDLYELAESVVEALREKAQAKRVSVSISGERFCVYANRQMMDELLYNLVDNAIKYNREGGSVTVALSLESGAFGIAVSDTGIGIPAAHQGRVFERFYRADKSRSKKTGGTGLGLSIVKHITEHNGGRVALSSVEGVGTTVECHMPSRI